ncbi:MULTISPECIES: hypothetical protein [Clostridium]|uniref:hypothetical protein n=1 Tax=Clostridium TaxID=1485 RepID=UPI000CC1F8F0|nr:MULTISPECIES: hypothetical protein [Clostridium]PJI09673.1 hypothetical protein CUB90_18155 [Clostridium sp. CT7]
MKFRKNSSETNNSDEKFEFKDKAAFIIAAFEVFMPVFLILGIGVALVILFLLKVWL